MKVKVEAEVRDRIRTSLNYYTPSKANMLQVDSSKWLKEGGLARQTVSCAITILTEIPNY